MMQPPVQEPVGGIGVEAVKAGLATLAGLAVAGALAFTGVAVFPLIGLVAVTLVAGYLLNVADDHYKIKKRVIEALKTVPEQTAQGIYTINTPEFDTSSPSFRDFQGVGLYKSST